MTYTEKVREHMEDCIYPVLARAEVFAQELGISETTLRRRLEKEGTTWTALYKAEIHKRIVKACNANMSAEEMNAQLGYSDIGAMHRVKREAMREHLTDAPSFLTWAS